MRIGIIGASSQVGASLALYFKHLYNVEAQCFIRSSYSNIFFRLFDIPVTSVNFDNKEELRKHLAGIDVVVDCTYPTGQLFEIPALICKTSESVISAMQRGSSYIYMSSIMAYGMPADQKMLQQYRVPRSSYAYIKRHAEKNIKKICSRYSIDLYLFRLGQVHGFLQSVSSSYRDKLKMNPVFNIDGKEQDVTNTVFISSICEAVAECAKKNQKPGLYTIVSEPQWTLLDLYGFYINQYGISSSLNFVPYAVIGKQTGIKSRILSFAKKQRPLIESYILMKNPALSVKLKGRYRESEIKRAESNVNIAYPDFNLLGPPAHPTVQGVSYDIEDVAAKEKEMEDYYNMIIENAGYER